MVIAAVCQPALVLSGALGAVATVRYLPGRSAMAPTGIGGVGRAPAEGARVVGAAVWCAVVGFVPVGAVGFAVVVARS
jgi:hypothetical protein